MQGQLKDVFTVRDKMYTFQKKILLCQLRLAEEDLQMFQNFDEYMKEKYVNQRVVAIVQQHLESLTESFCCYFPKKEDSRHGNMWIIDPFAANNENSKLNMSEKESLIDLSSDSSLKTKFLELSKCHFCGTLKMNTHC